MLRLIKQLVWGKERDIMKLVGFAFAHCFCHFAVGESNGKSATLSAFGTHSVRIFIFNNFSLFSVFELYFSPLYCVMCSSAVWYFVEWMRAQSRKLDLSEDKRQASTCTFSVAYSHSGAYIIEKKSNGSWIDINEWKKHSITGQQHCINVHFTRARRSPMRELRTSTSFSDSGNSLDFFLYLRNGYR